MTPYPKVTYMALLLFACTSYGYYNTKKEVAPMIANQETQTQENPIRDLQSLKVWIKSGLNSMVNEVFG